MPLPGVAFTALLVSIVAGSTVHGTVIPEPQNVTLKCEKQFPILQWDYSHQQPQTLFRVNISGSAGAHEYETTEHRFDLSKFIWESEDRYMAYHSVSVTAVMGGIKSNSVKPISFTFNQMKLADIICELDFPTVTLTAEGTVSFPNPFSFYPELEQAIKPKSALFWFEISASGNDYEGDCRVDQKICKYDLSVSDNVETCIKLKGWLMEGNEVGRVRFRETDDVCPSPSIGVHWAVIIVMLAVFFVLLVIIIFFVCNERAWMLKTQTLPGALDLLEPIISYKRYSTLDSNATMSRVQVVHRQPSVDSMEEEQVSPTADPCDGSSGPGPQNPPRDAFYTEGALLDSNGSQEAMGLMSEGQTTDDDSANCSIETESVSMNSTEGEGEGEARSPYDCPHSLHIDMGDGNTVVGYTGS